MAVWRLQRAYCPMEEWLDWDVNDLSGDNKFDLVESSMRNYETNCRDYI